MLIHDTLKVLQKFDPGTDTGFQLHRNLCYAKSEIIIDSPVLGAPYHMFYCIMEGIHLARDMLSNSRSQESLAWSRYHQVCRMCVTLENTMTGVYDDPRTWIGKLYAVGIKLLFLYIIAASKDTTDHTIFSDSDWTRECDTSLKEARRLLTTTGDGELDRTWGKFFLWPLAIISAVLHDDVNDVAVLRRWLDRVSRQGINTSVLAIRKVLEECIWKIHPSPHSMSNASITYRKCIETILNCEVMNQTFNSVMLQR